MKIKDLGVVSGFSPRMTTVHITKVVESPFLSVLRKRAANKAGIKRIFDGSAEQYLKFSEGERARADTELSLLVQAHWEIIHSNPKDHIEIEARPEVPNLALDSGIDRIFSNPDTGGTPNAYGFFNNIACAGTGTTPTFVDSGAITATASGTTVTSSASFFTSGMTGYLIKFDSGEERYITFVNATSATLNASLTIGSATLFTVYAVNQTGLVNEVKRTHTFLTGSGNTGSTDTSSTRSYKVTHDFTAEVSNTNYTELGWSASTTVGNNLSARSLISGGTVTVLIGQQLRTIHTMVLTLSPVTSTAGTYTISGWPVSPSTNTDGNYIIAQPFAGDTLSALDGNGGSNAGQIDSLARPFLATGSTLPSPGNPFTTGTASAPTSNQILSYTAGSFFRDAESFWALNDGNRTDWRAIYCASTFSTSFVFVFGQAQTKDNAHTLRVRVRYSCSRQLTNP